MKRHFPSTNNPLYNQIDDAPLAFLYGKLKSADVRCLRPSQTKPGAADLGMTSGTCTLLVCIPGRPGHQRPRSLLLPLIRL